MLSTLSTIDHHCPNYVYHKEHQRARGFSLFRKRAWIDMRTHRLELDHMPDGGQGCVDDGALDNGGGRGYRVAHVCNGTG